VWDSTDIPARELFIGRPAGSAMPLVWAHAEYLKLCRSLHDGSVFDQPPQTVQRYLVDRISSDHTSWRFNDQIRTLPRRSVLRIETLASAVVHWTADGWRNVHQTPTVDTTLGIHVADLETESLPEGDHVELTFFWLEAGRWEGTNFPIAIV
jgi:glucoamylase